MINGKQFAVYDATEGGYVVNGYGRSGVSLPYRQSERPIALYNKVGQAKAIRTKFVKRHPGRVLEVHEVEVVRRAVL